MTKTQVLCFLALMVGCGSSEPPTDDGVSPAGGGGSAAPAGGAGGADNVSGSGGATGLAGSNASGSGGMISSGDASSAASGGARDAATRESGMAVEAGITFDAGTMGDGDFTINAPFHD